MNPSLRNRTLAFVTIMVFSVLYLLPTFVGDALPSWYYFEKKINLGLDLKGGAQFVYSIDLDVAVDDKASEIKRDLEIKLGEKQVAAAISTPSVAPGALNVKLTDPAKKADVEKLIGSDYAGILQARACSEDAATTLCMRIASSYADSVRRGALEQAVKTVRERVDEDGVAERTVIRKDDQIIVELPGLAEESTNRIKELIARTAKLEFKIVANDTDVMRAIFRHVGPADSPDKPHDPEAIDQGIKAYIDSWNAEKSGDKLDDYFLVASDRDEVLSVEEARAINCYDKTKVVNGKITCNVSGRRVLERYLAKLAAEDPSMKPGDDYQFAFEYTVPQGGEGGETRPFWRTYYLERAVRLTGSAVSNAMANWDQTTGRPEVVVDFNRYGGRLFGDLTAANVGKKMAIILDDKVTSAPIIQGAIRQGRSTITVGGANPEQQEAEATGLVNVLKTGSLPAPLVEKKVSLLGPTLGRDAVGKAQLAFGLGGILVMAIMGFIYRGAGVIAMAGTVINILLQLMVMAMFGANLSLPGIAALVLTIGFGVDGNILIYERIRDELLLGKSVKGAVDIGFSRAFSSILDGQLTTAAAGWVLLQYGSGPIHGFAVLLLIGIATTLFVNTWVTRLMFDWYISNKKGELATISI